MLRQVLLGSAAFAAIAAAVLSCAAADGAPAPSAFNYTLGAEVASDYVWRGVDLLDSGPAVGGGAVVGFDRAYAGVVVNRIDLGGGKSPNRTSAQTDFFVGYRFPFLKTEVDVGLEQHVFFRQQGKKDLDFYEAKLGVSRGLPRFGLHQPPEVKVSLAWSPNTAGPQESALYTEAAVAAEVWPKVRLDAGIGWQSFFDGYTGDYTTWHAGATFAVFNNFSIYGRYVDSNSKTPWFGSRVNGQAVAGIVYTL